MAIELDQDIMVTYMCSTFVEDWTNGFQELDRKQSSGRMYVRTYVRTRATLYAATLWEHNYCFFRHGNYLDCLHCLHVTTQYK